MERDIIERFNEFVSTLKENFRNLVQRSYRHEQIRKGVAEVMLPAFEVYQDRGGKWRWRLRAVNGRIICDSAQGYINREDAYAGINSVRKYANSQIVLLESNNEDK